MVVFMLRLRPHSSCPEETKAVGVWVPYLPWKGRKTQQDVGLLQSSGWRCKAAQSDEGQGTKEEKQEVSGKSIRTVGNAGVPFWWPDGHVSFVVDNNMSQSIGHRLLFLWFWSITDSTGTQAEAVPFFLLAMCDSLTLRFLFMCPMQHTALGAKSRKTEVVVFELVCFRGKRDYVLKIIFLK